MMKSMKRENTTYSPNVFNRLVNILAEEIQNPGDVVFEADAKKLFSKLETYSRFNTEEDTVTVGWFPDELRKLSDILLYRYCVAPLDGIDYFIRFRTQYFITRGDPLYKTKQAIDPHKLDDCSFWSDAVRQVTLLSIGKTLLKCAGFKTEGLVLTDEDVSSGGFLLSRTLKTKTVEYDIQLHHDTEDWFIREIIHTEEAEITREKTVNYRTLDVQDVVVYL